MAKKRGELIAPFADYVENIQTFIIEQMIVPQFKKVRKMFPDIKSLTVCVYQAYTDDARDEVHAEFVYSVLDRPDIAAAKKSYLDGNRDPINLPFLKDESGENDPYAGTLFDDICGDKLIGSSKAFPYYWTIFAFNYFCPPENWSDDGNLENASPAVTLYLEPQTNTLLEIDSSAEYQGAEGEVKWELYDNPASPHLKGTRLDYDEDDNPAEIWDGWVEFRDKFLSKSTPRPKTQPYMSKVEDIQNHLLMDLVKPIVEDTFAKYPTLKSCGLYLEDEIDTDWIFPYLLFSALSEPDMNSHWRQRDAYHYDPVNHFGLKGLQNHLTTFKLMGYWHDGENKVSLALAPIALSCYIPELTANQIQLDKPERFAVFKKGPTGDILCDIVGQKHRPQLEGLQPKADMRFSDDPKFPVLLPANTNIDDLIERSKKAAQRKS